MAGSSVTFTDSKQPSGDVHKLTIDWVSDSATGGASGTTTFAIDGELHKLVTDPGSPAPDVNYDIVINDEEGLDVLQGVGANRHTTTSEEARVVYSGTAVNPVVADRLTFQVTNAGNSKQGQAHLYYKVI